MCGLKISDMCLAASVPVEMINRHEHNKYTFKKGIH